VSRGWIVRTTVRVYPAHVRDAKGDEFVGTLLDASEDSAVAFIKELASLVVAGLLSRSRDALSSPVNQVVSDLVRWGAVIAIGRVMVGAIVTEASWGGALGGPETIWAAYIAPALILIAFISHHDKAAGITGLSWCVTEFVVYPQLSLNGWIATLLLPLIGCGVMIFVPRHEPDRGRIAIAIPLLAFAYFVLNEVALVSNPPSGVGFMLPVLVAPLFVPFKPACALGTTLAWLFLAASFLAVPGDHFTLVRAQMFGFAAMVFGLAVFARLALARE